MQGVCQASDKEGFQASDKGKVSSILQGMTQVSDRAGLKQTDNDCFKHQRSGNSKTRAWMLVQASDKAGFKHMTHMTREFPGIRHGRFQACDKECFKHLARKVSSICRPAWLWAAIGGSR